MLSTDFLKQYYAYYVLDVYFKKLKFLHHYVEIYLLKKWSLKIFQVTKLYIKVRTPGQESICSFTF